MLLALAEENAAAAITVPVIPKNTSNLFQAGHIADLFVDRAGTTGTFAVWGVDAGDVGAQTAAWRSEGDATSVNFVAPSTAINYAAFANYNWIVTVNGVVQTITTNYTVTDSAGGTNVALAARIVFAVAPAAGAKIEVFKGTPVAVYAASAARAARKRVRCYDFMWVEGATTPSATTIALVGTFS